MPSNNARVFARLMDWGAPSPVVAGQLLVRVEYSIIDTVRKDGKFAITLILTNGSRMRQDIVEGLVTYLNTRSPVPSPLYRERDIVLWGA